MPISQTKTDNNGKTINKNNKKNNEDNDLKFKIIKKAFEAAKR